MERETLAKNLRDAETWTPEQVDALICVVSAAQGFVATTSVFQQKVACRPSFEGLAVALLELDRLSVPAVSDGAA